MAGFGISAAFGIPGVGFPELIIILVIVLLLFGPKRLPQLGKSIGKTVKSLREGMDGKDGTVLEEAEDDAAAPKAAKKAAATTASDDEE